MHSALVPKNVLAEKTKTFEVTEADVGKNKYRRNMLSGVTTTCLDN